MPITVVPGSILMKVTQRPKVARPVVEGNSMSFTCQEGVTISGQCKIKGDPGDDPKDWTLGLIQLQWIETNWGHYRGPSISDGSSFLQRARPPARAAQGCRDTRYAGEFFFNNDPDKNWTVATAGTPFPIDMTAEFSDSPSDAYDLTRLNSLTGKTNFLREVQLEFHFCTILTLMDPAGNFRHLKHLLWNVHWQATFDPPDHARITADWTITLNRNNPIANSANASNAYDGGPEVGPAESKFIQIAQIATDPQAPNCNTVARVASDEPNTRESAKWANFDVTE